MKQLYSSWDARAASIHLFTDLRRWFSLALLLQLPWAAQAQTQTFIYTGGTQTYTVPAGTSRISVTATGGGNGNNQFGTGNVNGAVVQATLTVVPGEVLTVVVGGRGNNAIGGTGGYNGGGNSANTNGGGGGATDLRRTSATGDYLLTRNALVVAAGAGGTGYQFGAGGAAGTPAGGSGTSGSASSVGGVGATQTGPGSSGTLGNPGSNGTGGNSPGYGGGGGGYYGGGSGYFSGTGGSSDAGGGGGSSWVMPTGSSAISYSTAPTLSNGRLVITPVAAAPALTAVAPTPGGLGQAITLTGTDLSSATALTINGANAFANIISNTATSVVVRVPATAAASGNVSITTAGGTAIRAFTIMAAPGNALAFDGVNDYVALPSSTPVPLGNAAYTVEAWVNPNSMNLGSILGWGNYGTTNQANGLSLNTTGLINYWWGNDLQVATASLVGRWHHVAATYDGTTRRLYLNGVEIGSDVPGVHAVPNAQNLRIGSNSNGNFTYLNGRLDEVRVYSVALTPAQLQADMTSTAAAVPASLVLYYNMDQGTPATASTGANTGLTTLYDLNATTPGTLTNFALTSGNTTSNYVESYALVVPTATVATAIATTGFTANWTAPAVGTATSYLVDVATNATFTAGLTTTTVAAPALSQVITGLTAATTYYYRVRSDKASVAGQGAASNTITVTTAAVPTIISFTPTSGPVGQVVTITGTNFTNANGVSFGGALATFTVVNSTTITATVPAAAVTGPVRVAVPGTSVGSATNFTVLPTSLVCTTNNALNLDGANDYVRGTAALPATTALTLETWVYQEANGGFRTLLNGDNYPAGAVHIHMTNGTMQFTVNGSNPADYYASASVPLNTWAHVAVVYTSTGGAGGTVKFYLNGAPLNTITATSTRSIVSQSYSVGAWFDGVAQRFFDGSLNEMRVWNVARTDAQIAANYQAQLPAQAGLIARYSFNQGTAGGTNTAQTTLADDSGNGRPGSLTGFALTTGTQSNYVVGNDLNETFTLASFAPASGVVGQAITLTGTGFTGATGVSFNGTPATAFTVVNNTTITATVPTGATSGTLRVTTACGTVANANIFTVCAAPVAIAQNVTVNLDASGNATVTAAAVNNGSTADCGPAAASTLGLTETTNRLVNGTFDANANGWTPTNVDGNGGYRATGGNPGGMFILNDNGNASTDPTLSQTVTGLVSGATYVLRGDYRSFYIVGTPGAPALAVDLNGTQLTTFPAVGTTWTPFSLTFTASGTSQTLAFRGEIGGTDVDVVLDNLRLNQAVGTLSFTCANTGANPVLLTVTDAAGNISTAPAVVTVVDNTAPTAYVLPPAPALATTNVPEAAGYGVLYQLDMPNAASFNALTSVPYTVNNSGLALAKPARVAYFMELTNTSGVSKWVWASMDNFATTLAQLGLPNPTANNVVWNQNVTGLNVFASANAGLTTGSNIGTGRLEMWRFNYATNNASAVLNASETLYDFGDRNENARNYGSFQVHNVTARQTLLAYNNWGGEGAGGGIGDLGIGNQVGGSGHPDWTFAYNANIYTVKKIYVLVTKTETSPTASFTQPATVALDVNGNAAVTPALVYNGNAIDNCGSVTATVSPSNLTCANVGGNTVTVTLTDGNGNAISQTAVVTVTAPPTPTTTWDGSAGTAWTDCANWSFGKVPDAATNAVIPAGLTLYPNLTTGSFPVNSLTVNSGGSLTVASGATLQVNGNLTNNGTATLSGTVAFVGSAATQTLSNSGGFNTVMVNKPSGTVQLAQNLTINSALTLTTGTLTTTSSYQVNMGGSASLSESETSYVTGKVVVNRPLVAGTAQAFSGLGLTLTPAAGSVAPGATQVTRVTGTALTGVGTSVSVQRYFDIQPAVKTGLNVDMVFAYFDHELNNIPAANLALFKSVSSLTGPWANQTPITLGPKTVSKAGITDFSIWTLGNTANPLPVELAAFTATPQGNAAVRLAWATASEKNSARFDVERSLDGSGFATIGTVAAAGNTSSARAYELLDTKLPATATTLYYRLRQVDVDGTFSFSPVRVVHLSHKQVGELTLAPNPARATTLTGATAGASVTVFDAVGRLVLTATADATGTAQLVLPAYLPTGVYVVRTGAKAVRLVVE